MRARPGARSGVRGCSPCARPVGRASDKRGERGRPGGRMGERTDELVLTYSELGERLGLAPEGARAKAKRKARTGEWAIVMGNDGRARVRLPADGPPSARPTARPGARMMTSWARMKPSPV